MYTIFYKGCETYNQCCTDTYRLPIPIGKKPILSVPILSVSVFQNVSVSVSVSVSVLFGEPIHRYRFSKNFGIGIGIDLEREPWITAFLRVFFSLFSALFFFFLVRHLDLGRRADKNIVGIGIGSKYRHWLEKPIPIPIAGISIGIGI